MSRLSEIIQPTLLTLKTRCFSLIEELSQRLKVKRHSNLCLLQICSTCRLSEMNTFLVVSQFNWPANILTKSVSWEKLPSPVLKLYQFPRKLLASVHFEMRKDLSLVEQKMFTFKAEIFEYSKSGRFFMRRIGHYTGKHSH